MIKFLLEAVCKHRVYYRNPHVKPFGISLQKRPLILLQPHCCEAQNAGLLFHSI